MPFLTDLTVGDVVTLECDHDDCTLPKIQIRLKVTRQTATKIKVSIDADRGVKITKNKKKTRRVKHDRKGKK
jgi:hypothetical protein